MNNRSARVRRLPALVIVAASVSATVTIAMPRRAEADCIQGDVYVTRQGTTPTYITGPGSCVVPTPWTPQVINGRAEVSRDGLPPGTPNGVGVDVWLTLPPDP